MCSSDLLVNNPSVYQFQDSTYILNHNYLYLVRANKVGSGITSTSNAVSVSYTHSVQNPPLSQINGVSVLSSNSLKISGLWQKDGGSSVLLLQKQNGTNWQTIQSSSTNGNFVFNDNSVNTSSYKYSYRTLRKNDCGYIDDSCCVHQNILLRSQSNRTLTWSRYVGWLCPLINSSFDYTVEVKQGSTWNSLSVVSDTNFTAPNDLFGNQRFKIGRAHV